MWCGRTESVDAALDLFLRIFGPTPHHFQSSGICTNRRRCITDWPSIFSCIGTFTFTFLAAEASFWLVGCKMQWIYCSSCCTRTACCSQPVAQSCMSSNHLPTTHQPTWFFKVKVKRMSGGLTFRMIRSHFCFYFFHHCQCQPFDQSKGIVTNVILPQILQNTIMSSGICGRKSMLPSL